ncbi:MAG: hypothetical protein ACJA2M_001846 [Polaribacter sp.]|mgnify:CR=1 FL=1|jgi:hypothetical protein|tara:strand:- start:2632 stop:2979 length:348 start_codon:yes stop_codon:yes gene_type:complete
MSIGESVGETNKKAIDIGEKYLKTSYEYYKLKIFQQLTTTISLVFKAILIGSLLSVGLFFIALSLALFIGEILDSYTQGFMIMGLIFIFLSFIALLFKKRVNDFVVSILSEKFFN